ncbi:Inositol-1-monophosphatase [Buchnera aphidicola (Eriosoma lanigerum)]|uniref:inositol monophosphatase family protein n=1 Tax=Buchnera aphidicola TaxID=9 RepID=UPI00346403A5
MHPILNIAIRAIRKGGDFIAQKYDVQKNSIFNKNSIDNLENIIYISQKKMIEIISKSYPNHSIVINKIKSKDILNNIIWIINPLNGKTNFNRNIPHFCISIVITIKNKTEISVIYDPIKNELFSAIRGKGAQLNGYRMRCNNVCSLILSTLSIHISNQDEFNNILYLKIIKTLLNENINFRLSGSTTLDLAYVAAGRLDCVLYMNFKPWNVYAGELQLKESGALVCNHKVTHDHQKSNFFLTGNAKFIRLILKKIQDVFPL